MSEEVESVDDSDRDPNYVADSEISAVSVLGKNLLSLTIVKTTG